MKKTILMTMAVMMCISCGGIEEDINTNYPAIISYKNDVVTKDMAKVKSHLFDINQDKSQYLTLIPTMTLEVFTTCGKTGGIPTLEFYDLSSNTSSGTYSIDTPLKVINIQCYEGTELCWGAWLGKSGYYDCSQADKTGYCFLVKEDPEYYSWGCGKNCSHGASSWQCISCNNGYLGQISLNCGM